MAKKTTKKKAKPAAAKKPKKKPSVKKPAALADATHPSDAVVLACIKAQAGAAIITPNATLVGLGVDGFVLAGCINSQLGSKFKGSDFPPGMTVAQCVLFVRANS